MFSSQFKQPEHLHYSEHGTPCWKHSQYPFLHPDLLHVHPFRCFLEALVAPRVIDLVEGGESKALFLRLSVFAQFKFSCLIILLSKAFGFLFSISVFDSLISCSYMIWFEQHLQAHSVPQCIPDAKHSQYSFKHFDLVHEQRGPFEIKSIFEAFSSSFLIISYSSSDFLVWNRLWLFVFSYYATFSIFFYLIWFSLLSPEST